MVVVKFNRPIKLASLVVAIWKFNASNASLGSRLSLIISLHSSRHIKHTSIEQACLHGKITTMIRKATIAHFARSRVIRIPNATRKSGNKESLQATMKTKRRFASFAANKVIGHKIVPFSRIARMSKMARYKSTTLVSTAYVTAINYLSARLPPVCECTTCGQ